VGPSIGQADGRQCLARRHAGLAARRPGVLGREGDVLLGRQGRHEVERLEHEAHRAGPDARPLGVGQAGRVSPVHPKLGRRPVVAIRRVEQAQDVHQGALAGPGRAHDRDHLAGRDADVDAAQGLDARLA
jgi:hypothetical protein